MTAAKRRFVLRGLVAVNLLPFAAAGWWWPHACGLGNATSAQCMLLPFWAVLGTSRTAVRVVGLLAGCALLTLGFLAGGIAQIGTGTYALVWAMYFQVMGIVATIVVVVAGAMAVMRIAGLRLVCFVGRVSPRGPVWPRFSLGRLLILTGVAAAALSIGSFVRSASFFVDATSLMPSNSFLGLAAAVTMCVVAPAALSPAPAASRVALANVAAVMICLMECYYLRTPSADLLEGLLDALVESLWVSASLLVVRAGGYRAIWPSDWVWAAGRADELKV